MACNLCRIWSELCNEPKSADQLRMNSQSKLFLVELEPVTCTLERKFSPGIVKVTRDASFRSLGVALLHEVQMCASMHIAQVLQNVFE